MKLGAIGSGLLATWCMQVAQAALSDEELAKLAQNPVANLISLPFQNNANLNYGPQKQTQGILIIQPAIPIDWTPDWNLITRTIVPIISQPAIFPSQARIYGIAPRHYNVVTPTNGLADSGAGTGLVPEMNEPEAQARNSNRRSSALQATWR